MSAPAGLGGWDPSDPPEMIKLDDGREVPKLCVEALASFDTRYPGATFVLDRPLIVATILETVGFNLESGSNDESGN